MAEIVEFTKEQRLGELEELKRIKLLDDFEISKIKKQREYFEYKLVAQHKKLNDILKFISFENTILVLLQERRKSRNIFVKKIVEFRVITKISNLFQKAISRYPNNIEVWDKYIKFCKSTNNKPKVTALWNKYISFHGDKYLTWLKAGMWEYNENKNYIKSISYLTRGLQRHPRSFNLFLALIQVELKFAKELNSPLQGIDSISTSSLHKVHIFYEKMKEENLAVKENLLRLLKAIKDFDFAKALYNNILKDIKILDVNFDMAARNEDIDKNIIN